MCEVDRVASTGSFRGRVLWYSRRSEWWRVCHEGMDLCECLMASDCALDLQWLLRCLSASALKVMSCLRGEFKMYEREIWDREERQHLLIMPVMI